MAKKTKKATNGESQIPEGFRPATSSDCRVWYKAVPGAAIQGVVKGRFVRSSGRGHYYQIQLTQECEACMEDKEETVAGVGDLVNIDERAGLKFLAEQIGNEVYIAAKEKVKLDSGQTFWRFDCGYKEISDEDLPF